MNSKELLDKFRSLPLVSIPARHTWDRHRYELRHHVIELGGNMTNFLRMSTIQATMFVGEAPYVKPEYDALCSEWPDCLPAIEEGDTGGAPRLSFAPQTSGNMVHQAYHLLQLRRAGIDPIDGDIVVEFGGGYGAMARLFRRLGYTGKYYIHDFIEFQWLQEYYLEREGVPVNFGYAENADLVIACYSMTEAPPEQRIAFMSRTTPRRVLIAYASVYGEYHPPYEIETMLSTMGYNFVVSDANPRSNHYSVGVKIVDK